VSIKAVSFAQVACDNCGVVHKGMQRGGTSARIAASRDGWRFAEFPELPRNKEGPRQWDSCPDCEIPASGQDAMTLYQARSSGGSR
jgi:hypothetical protein